MAGINEYSTTPASNTAINGIDIAENCAPSGMNNAQRQALADIRAAFNDIGGKQVSGGSANAQTLTTETVYTAYADGTMLAFIAGFTNTGAATLNVDSVGAKAIRKGADTALSAGDITAGMLCIVCYDASANSAAGAWMLANPLLANALIAAAVIGDNRVVRGDGGARGVQSSGVIIDDSSNITPAADDTGGLGTASLKWADLFGASGFVLNFNNGDVTITHSSNLLTLAGGNFDFGDNQLIRALLKDYGEEVNALGSGGGTRTVDLTLGNVVTLTVATSTNDIVINNPTASGDACSLTIIMTNGGSQTVNWPASVDWAGGSAPSLTASGVDVVELVTTDGGTTWYGFPAGLDLQ